MKEILFKGKRADNGEWVEGYYAYQRKSLTDKERYYILTNNGFGFSWQNIVPETLCQYSGLTDKNENKIFEGDIISYQRDNEDCPFPNKDTNKRIGRVFFQDFRASFAVAEGRNGSDMLNQDLYRYVRGGNRTEVIGNIFDNPELLTEV